MSREIQFAPSEATALINIGHVISQQGEYKEAIDYTEDALVLYRKMDDRSGEAQALANIGCNYEYAGKTEKALEYLRESLRIYSEIGEKDGVEKVSNAIKEMEKEAN